MAECEVYTKKVLRKFNSDMGQVNYERINDNWLNDYKQFTKDKEHYVKIYDIEYHNDYFLINMEKLDYISTAKQLIREWVELNLNYKDIENLYKIVLSTFTDSIDSRKDNHLFIPCYWVHDDFHLGNILFLKDRSFKIIDPNAFRWKRGAPCNERTMSALNECLFLCMEKYYNVKNKELKKLYKNVDKYSLLTDIYGVEDNNQKKFLDEILNEEYFLDDPHESSIFNE